MAPLILLHAPATAAKAHIFARHAQFLYHHLLGKLRGSPRYRCVVLVGLEDMPGIVEPEAGGKVAGGAVVLALDGFTTHSSGMPGGAPQATVNFTSPAGFVDSVQQALFASIAPPTGTERRRSKRREGTAATEDEEEDNDDDVDEDEEEGGSVALGIDSLNMLAHRLGGMPPTMQALRKILSRSSSSSSVPLSPVLSVVHTEGGGVGRSSLLSPTWRLALEDLATTNVYIYPHDETTGRCFLVRKSVSGQVHEEWEGDAVEGPGQVRVYASGTSQQAGAAKSDASTATGNGESKKEAAFLESLPFRLSLSEQERAMRGQTVLPHERQRTFSGVPGGGGGGGGGKSQQQPLIYHEDEDFDEDDDGKGEEEEEYDENADDDLDF
jgi:hypothetical protein